jgi:hypothetical protein
MAEALMAKVVAWEKERGAKFEYDGVRAPCKNPDQLTTYVRAMAAAPAACTSMQQITLMRAGGAAGRAG